MLRTEVSTSGDHSPGPCAHYASAVMPAIVHDDAHSSYSWHQQQTQGSRFVASGLTPAQACCAVGLYTVGIAAAHLLLFAKPSTCGQCSRLVCACTAPLAVHRAHQAAAGTSGHAAHALQQLLQYNRCVASYGQHSCHSRGTDGCACACCMSLWACKLRHSAGLHTC